MISNSEFERVYENKFLSAITDHKLGWKRNNVKTKLAKSLLYYIQLNIF